MAKSPFWLRGARGKFAGSVLQKGEKGTIIRENVKPRNPQTRKQMIQRVVFGTLTTAASWMQRIVGQTFESAENEVMNKRLFVAENTTPLRAQALNGYYGSISTGAFLPKGMRILVPNAYVISNGSVPLPQQLQFAYDVVAQVPSLVTPTKNVTLVDGELYTAAQLWQALTGLKPGQQATLVIIETQNGESVAYDAVNRVTAATAGLDIVRYGDMSAARLVLKEGAGDSITYVAGTTTLANILTCMDSLIDEAKTAGAMWNVTGNGGFAACITSEGNVFSFKADGLIAEFTSSEYTIQAAGIIISELRNSKWAYSRTIMGQIPPEYYDSERTPFDQYIYGLRIDEAINTYLASSATASEEFTRQGGEDDTIGDSF